LVSSNVEVSGFKPRKKRGVTPRTDKGKKHNYPEQRAAPYTYCKRKRFKPSKHQLTINYFAFTNYG